MGVATGCGCKEVYRFPLLLIPTPLVSVLFAAASLHRYSRAVCSMLLTCLVLASKKK